jgi:glutamate N-acetyltransferase/amino-acid N-acetyltransferase
MHQFHKKPLSIAGCRLASVAAGIRYKNRDDLVLMELAPGSVAAGVFTQNTLCAAPVIVARKHLSASSPRYFLINSGNANAGTGEEGYQKALASCDSVASHFNVDREQVLPFSTGVIGQQLAVEKIVQNMPSLDANLAENGWEKAARAIMTTDTQMKVASVSVPLSNGEIAISGIAKGSGMIHPNMATMLAFAATDLTLNQSQAYRFNLEAAERSFNRISVDGDSSTNDACILAATGSSGVFLEEQDKDLFASALKELYLKLAQKIVLDGEGATKFISVVVEQGADSAECLQVARTVSCSPLVKTAWYASDPNWGRILAAVGNADIGELNPVKVNIYLDDVRIVKAGGLDPEYREEQGQKVFDKSAFEVRIELGRGDAKETVWTCDLSHEYVTINAEYRT